MDTRPTTDRYGPLVMVLMVLTIIGALNWGLIGFFNFNLVDAIFGGGAREETAVVSRVVYALVGLAALGLAVLLPGKRLRIPTRQSV